MIYEIERGRVVYAKIFEQPPLPHQIIFGGLRTQNQNTESIPTADSFYVQCSDIIPSCGTMGHFQQNVLGVPSPKV
jgi:hypothetical protein